MAVRTAYVAFTTAAGLTVAGKLSIPASEAKGPAVGICHGSDRGEGIARLTRALDFLVVEGVRTSADLPRRIVRDPVFIAGDLSTRYLEQFFEREAQERGAAPEGESL